MKFQVSVRELMLVVFVVGLGLAGLSAGGWIASLTLLLLATVVTAFAIVAFVGHGRRRSFAIGYLIPFFFYAVAHTFVGASELDPYGKLPTTRLFKPLFEQVVRREYINARTGQPIPNYDPRANQGLGGGGLGGFVGVQEIPDRSTFMLLAHVLFATAFAYAGGKFAVCIHYYDVKPEASDEPSDTRAD